VEQAQGMALPQIPYPAGQARKRSVMNVTIPAFVLVAAIVFIAWRYIGLRLWQAALCILLGILLAFTGAKPEISSILTGITHWLDKQ
jgi:hypothetical protein